MDLLKMTRARATSVPEDRRPAGGHAHRLGCVLYLCLHSNDHSRDEGEIIQLL